jgi:hypothetical protein
MVNDKRLVRRRWLAAHSARAILLGKQSIVVSWRQSIHRAQTIFTSFGFVFGTVLMFLSMPLLVGG